MGRYLITGGTGSLGQALIKRLTKRGDEISVVSRDEYKQRRQMPLYPNVKYFVGDVRDRSRMGDVIRDVDIVIHTAALKHVPTGEEMPEETTKTNVFGTMNVINSIIRSNVKKMVYIGTDKGSHPINLYGMSKAVSERLMIAANQKGKSFVGVRYGNVIGSRGSVIEKILEEKPDKMNINDKRMTRFWMTLEMACDIIFKAIDYAKPGEIFIPKIKSLGVEDMFRFIAPKMRLIEKGMIPGEKLHETLINSDESMHTTEYDDFWSIEPELFGVKYHEPFTYTSYNAPRLTKEEFLKML